MTDDINTLPITLTLDVNRINVILRSLGKHPFDEINVLIKTITEQGEEQIREWQRAMAEIAATKADEEELSTEEVVEEITTDLDQIVQDESVLDEVVA